MQKTKKQKPNTPYCLRIVCPDSLEFTDVPLGTAQLVLTLLLAFQPKPKTKRTKSLCEYVFSCEAVGRTTGAAESRSQNRSVLVLCLLLEGVVTQAFL